MSGQFYEVGRLYVRHLTAPDEWALRFGQPEWGVYTLISHVRQRPWWDSAHPTVVDDYASMTFDTAPVYGLPDGRTVRWEEATDAFLVEALRAVTAREQGAPLRLPISRWIAEGLQPSEADRIRAAVAATGRRDFILA